jgi:hypothetical protein
MKGLEYLVTAATLAFTATATISVGNAEHDQPKKDSVQKPLDPRAPGTDGATVTTVKYGSDTSQ